MKGNQTNEVITDKNIKSNNEEFKSNKQIAEIFKDLCKAPIGAVNDDFTIDTMKDSHTDLCIRTIAGHLYANGYRKERQGEWIDKPTGAYGRMQSWCSACGKHSGIGGIESNRHKPFCPNCGAKMKGAE